MKLRAISIAAGAVAAIALAMPQAASASLIYQADLLAPAQGFGNAPRDLTLQATGQADTFESGAVGVAGRRRHHVRFADRRRNLPIPMASRRRAVPTTCRIRSRTTRSTAFRRPDRWASRVRTRSACCSTPREPRGDSVNVVDVTLKFYSSTGTFLGAIDGSQPFASSNPGNGVAGFTFVVSADEQAM